MAKRKTPQMRDRKDTITRITDVNRDVIAEIGLQEYTIKYSDGSIRHRRISESLTLSCGTVWNPASQEPIGVCSQCRAPSFFGRPTHGLVALKNAVRCIVCGRLLCRNHAKRGRDNQYRCAEDHRTYQIGAFLRPIFCEREED
jgi:hypothetical protein